MKFDMIEIPKEGRKITVEKGVMAVPDDPIIPFIEGDGIGPDIMKSSMKVWNSAVEKAYKNSRKIVWTEIYAGNKANEKYGNFLPQDTINAIKHFIVAVKGPLITPVSGGFRSLNVALRQKLNLYACIRPVKYYKGVPSPVKEPEKMDMVIFRENTEDVYAGIEWQEGSEEAKKLISFLKKEYNTKIKDDSGLGIKPISITGTKQLVRKAIQYAIDKKRKSVTLVHKGNIMKYTEGAFRDWGYEVATEEFADKIITENKLWEQHNGNIPEGKIVVKDRIADSMFQQVLTRTDEYDVIALPNLNGDYLSDACAAQIGGLGMAPGANMGDYIALMEPTHGSAPKYANKDKVNPSALILSGALLLEYIGWDEAAKLIEESLKKTIVQKKVTYDLHRILEGAKLLKTSDFAEAVVGNM